MQKFKHLANSALLEMYRTELSLKSYIKYRPDFFLINKFDANNKFAKQKNCDLFCLILVIDKI